MVQLYITENRFKPPRNPKAGAKNARTKGGYPMADKDKNPRTDRDRTAALEDFWDMEKLIPALGHEPTMVSL